MMLQRMNLIAVVLAAMWMPCWPIRHRSVY